MWNTKFLNRTTKPKKVISYSRKPDPGRVLKRPSHPLKICNINLINPNLPHKLFRYAVQVVRRLPREDEVDIIYVVASGSFKYIRIIIIIIWCGDRFGFSKYNKPWTVTIVRAFIAHQTHSENFQPWTQTQLLITFLISLHTRTLDVRMNFIYPSWLSIYL